MAALVDLTSVKTTSHSHNKLINKQLVRHPGNERHTLVTISVLHRQNVLYEFQHVRLQTNAFSITTVKW